ncbi:MAG TPA: molecular chaperone DnaK, partial [Saprospiraceae bacterium]|nr:molecular chaperone DnaK [Saprospiraceae bacterium]
AHTAQDIAHVERATEALNNAWHAASEDLYKASQEAGAGSAGHAQNGAGQTDSTSDVTDAEFEEVTDK